MAAICGAGMFSEAFNRRDFTLIADRFVCSFLLVALIALVLVFVAADVELGVAAAFRILSLSLLFGGASTVCGWLLGLLFGIPRSLSKPNTEATPAGARQDPVAHVSTSRVNTNLEDISDWLTKTIIGVGLTQLYQLPHVMWKIALRADLYGFHWQPNGPLLAIVLFLYFAPGGFWIGYVGTRTILTLLFGMVDGGLDAKKLATSLDPANLRLKNKTIASGPDPLLNAADNVLLSIPFDQLQTPSQRAAWGAAQARANNLPVAVTALEAALLSEPENTDYKQQLAKIYIALDRPAKAEKLLRGLPDADLDVLTALYEPPPAGFKKAIVIGERLLKDKDQANNANLHVWMACAYAQQYRDALNKKDVAGMNAARDKMLDEVKAALKADPSTKGWLHSLWKPAPGAVDDDLEVMADNADLKALLES